MNVGENPAMTEKTQTLTGGGMRRDRIFPFGSSEESSTSGNVGSSLKSEESSTSSKENHYPRRDVRVGEER
ncbi:hypothetical protein Tco_0975659 [Tanacetum coccineum]|uniref:Uncharacterized protein n=1 Tax=Tanacetum coccineum TaxID=301880 RepID=A0ABQ5EFC0_9ASTR